MITAVDTSVLLDVFLADPQFGPTSREALRRCLAEGRVIASAPVVAEVTGVFGGAGSAREALGKIPVEFDALNAEAAFLAGEAMRTYRDHGGRRDRVVADFLIGAHAQCCAERLLTRDRGFHRTYFTGLSILDPSAAKAGL